MADSGDSSSSRYYAEQNVQTAVGAAMIALSIFFVALRFYVRMRFNKAPLGWDDWLALAALVATVAAGLLVLMGMLNFCFCYKLSCGEDRPGSSPVTPVPFLTQACGYGDFYSI